MPPKRNSQGKVGRPRKKQRVATKKTPPKTIDHIVELLTHSDLKDLVYDLVQDPVISESVTKHLFNLEHAAAQTTYQGLIEEFSDFRKKINSVRYGADIWGYDGLEVPDFWEDIELLRKAGRQGLELAWQALLVIADNYKHNGEQGYKEADGPNKFDDDEFHWEVDGLMLECCIQLEAEAPEHLKPGRRIRELNQFRRKMSRSYPDLAYRYFFTIRYLKWVQGGKVGTYEKPDDYKPKPLPVPTPSPRVAGVRPKQTARKYAPSYMRSSKYMLAFAGREDLFEDGDDESDGSTSSDDEDEEDEE